MSDNYRSGMITLWDYINKYAESCGGDTSAKTVSVNRQKIVAEIERIVREMLFENKDALTIDGFNPFLMKEEKQSIFDVDLNGDKFPSKKTYCVYTQSSSDEDDFVVVNRGAKKDCEDICYSLNSIMDEHFLNSFLRK